MAGVVVEMDEESAAVRDWAAAVVMKAAVKTKDKMS
jgi:hypothetical protein